MEVEEEIEPAQYNRHLCCSYGSLFPISLKKVLMSIKKWFFYDLNKNDWREASIWYHVVRRRRLEVTGERSNLNPTCIWSVWIRTQTETACRVIMKTKRMSERTTSGKAIREGNFRLGISASSLKTQSKFCFFYSLNYLKLFVLSF